MSYLAMTVLVLEEQLLGHQINSERSRCYAEAGKGALEAIVSSERSGITPCFAAKGSSQSNFDEQGERDSRSFPGIFAGLTRGSDELLDVETGKVLSRGHCNCWKRRCLCRI